MLFKIKWTCKVIIINCYFILIQHIIYSISSNRARDALKLCLPEALKGDTFAPIIRSEETVQRWLSLLLMNISDNRPNSNNPYQIDPNIPQSNLNQPPNYMGNIPPMNIGNISRVNNLPPSLAQSNPSAQPVQNIPVVPSSTNVWHQAVK